MSDVNDPPPAKRIRLIHIDDQPDQPWLSKASAAAARDGVIGGGTAIVTAEPPALQTSENIVGKLDCADHKAPCRRLPNELLHSMVSFLPARTVYGPKDSIQFPAPVKQYAEKKYSILRQRVIISSSFLKKKFH